MRGKWVIDQINARQAKIQLLIHDGQSDNWMRSSYEIIDQLLSQLAQTKKETAEEIYNILSEEANRSTDDCNCKLDMAALVAEKYKIK